MNEKLIYQIGYRDGFATILAETYEKVKLKDIAEYYEKNFGEHFSLQWHKN
jgi:hypothetical protein